MTAHTHCNHCGTKYDKYYTLTWPRKCDAQACGKMTWANPIPVAVAVTRVYLTEDGTTNTKIVKDLGLLGVKRKVGPNGIALPGGFVDNEEQWQDTLLREVREEVGVELTLGYDELVKGNTEAILSTPDGTRVLMFAYTDPLCIKDLAELDGLGYSNETDGVALIGAEGGHATNEIIFSLHQQVAEQVLHQTQWGYDPLEDQTATV